MNSQTPSDRPPGFWSSLFTDEASFPRALFNGLSWLYGKYAAALR